MVQIEKIEKNRSDLKIKWSDGEESRFNYMWLRDNCPTAHDKDSHHRMFNILDVSKDLSIKNFKIDEAGSCLLYTSPSPRDGLLSRMPSSA